MKAKRGAPGSDPSALRASLGNRSRSNKYVPLRGSAHCKQPILTELGSRHGCSQEGRLFRNRTRPAFWTARHPTPSQLLRYESWLLRFNTATRVACATAVAYSIPLQSGRTYVGQTGRCLKVRLRENHLPLKGPVTSHLSSRWLNMVARRMRKALTLCSQMDCRSHVKLLFHIAKREDTCVN